MHERKQNMSTNKETPRSLDPMRDVLKHFSQELVRGDYLKYCPHCGAPKVCHIDFANNAFRCNVCEASGGYVIMFKLLKEGIYDKHAVENKKYIYEIFQEINGSPVEVVPVKEYKKIDPVKTNNKNDPAMLDLAYRFILSKLALCERDKKDLLRRGFSEEEISKFNFKTAPSHKVCSSITKEMAQKGIPIAGTPGCFKEENTWKFISYPAGYFIPAVDQDGYIVGLQERVTAPIQDGSRYLSVSSSKFNEGTGGVRALDVNGDIRKSKEIIITEGPLKGKLIYVKTGKTTIALPGVNAISLLESLLNNDIANDTLFYLAYDMDYVYNKNVLAQEKRLMEFLSAKGKKYKRIIWNIEDGKGIDDWYYNRYLRK